MSEFDGLSGLAPGATIPLSAEAHTPSLDGAGGPPMKVQEIRQIDRYAVKRFIAEGGFAWIFEVVASFEGVELTRALKMLKPATHGDEIERFRNEASWLAGIHHPNLVTIHEFGRDETTGCLFYTMEFIDGPTLDEYCAAAARPSQDEILDVFDDALAGLDEIHKRGLVHRDMKPANVLIGSDGRARVADLGIARTQEGCGLTKTGVALGTVAYMSPDQLRGDTVAASDVFSVGLMLYEALAGRHIYEATGGPDPDNASSVIMYLGSLEGSGEEIDFGPANPDVPPSLAGVIERACRMRPRDRYQDAGELRAALREARAGSDVPTTPMSSHSSWRRIIGGTVGTLVSLLVIARVADVPNRMGLEGIDTTGRLTDEMPVHEPDDAEASIDEEDVLPRIVSFSPSEPLVRVSRNERITFAVEAESANQENLTFEWTFEARRLDEKTARLRFRPQGSGDLEVAVLDTRGRSDTRHWRLEVSNSAPVVSVSPGGETIAMSLGEEQTFVATTDDPDGDAVDLIWKLDGVRVATGPSYAFSAVEEGSHRLDLIATDARGARSREKRRLLVSSIGGIAVRPGLAVPKEVLAALRQYREAIEAKDLARLRDVWLGLTLFPQGQGDRWIPRYRGMFDSPRPIRLDLRVEGISAISRGEVALTLQQTMKRGNLDPHRHTYRVALLKRRDDDHWQITTVE